jgi:hypothetical protein
MFSPAELRRLVEGFAPRSAHVEVDADLPERLELTVDAEDAALPTPFFETQGLVHETPSGFRSTGDTTVYRSRPPEVHELRLTDDPLALEGSHVVPVTSPVAGFVASPDTVRASVSSFLAALSETVGAEVEVGIEEHTSERTLHGDVTAVDAEYAARLDGLVDVTESEGKPPEFNDATLDISRGDETRLRWGFDLSNHGALFATPLKDRGYGGIQEARNRSGFTQEVEWCAESTRSAVSAEVSYTTQNAPLYLEELSGRGIPTPTRRSLRFEYDKSGGKTSVSFDSQTDGEPNEGVRDRLEDWTAFVPSPVAPFLSYIS